MTHMMLWLCCHTVLSILLVVAIVFFLLVCVSIIGELFWVQLYLDSHDACMHNVEV